MLFSQGSFVNFAAAFYKFQIRSPHLSENTLVSKKEKSCSSYLERKTRVPGRENRALEIFSKATFDKKTAFLKMATVPNE
jgi:hypothetical protein